MAVAVCASVLSCASRPASNLADTSLIPYPDSVAASGGWFELPTSLSIATEGDGLDELVQSLITDLKLFDQSAEAGSSSPSVILSLQPGTELGKEGYTLTISDSQIRIQASDPAGVFYGTQTFLQLVSAATQGDSATHTIPTGVIRDSPSYAWRGSMLDVARHFFSVEDVKRYIDLISHYKMNILHLHLTDDQGWRIEIKSWPKLTTVGGSTEVGGGKGGFYTQQDYAELVAYAEKRFVTLVPEIDLPGHINAALASYGELNSGIVVPEKGRVPNPQTDSNPKVQPTDLYSGVEVGWSTLSPSLDATFPFLEDVIREVASITPGPYLHIGGDEAHVTPKANYILFVDRLSEMVRKNNKVLIGWEEIAQAAIDTNAIAQHWASEAFAQQAAAKGAKIIMSPSKRVYLDMQYDSTSRIGLHWAAYIEVDDAYNWNPESHINGINESNILGIEAPLWSETVTNMKDIEYLAFPRLTGVAELAWTPKGNREWKGYSHRLGNHANHFKALRISYYPSDRIVWNR